jgi:starch synthase
MTRDYGARLENLLHHRSFDVHGILNGIDTHVWDPNADKHIPSHFNAEHPENRLNNKRALQTRLGLPERDDIPLLAMVTRLDYQKGVDLMGEILHRLLNNYAGEAQFVVLGSGADEYENTFRHMERFHAHKTRAVMRYAAELAPLIYAGADIFLMPSRFEPCGLGQLIAMRYGCVPVVRATGGLVDTVWEDQTGFLFHNFHVDAFWGAIQKAIYIYNVDKGRWRYIQSNGMQQNYSWERSAEKYLQMYEWAQARLKAMG